MRLWKLGHVDGARSTIWSRYRYDRLYETNTSFVAINKENHEYQCKTTGVVNSRWSYRWGNRLINPHEGFHSNFILIKILEDLHPSARSSWTTRTINENINRVVVCWEGRSFISVQDCCNKLSTKYSFEASATISGHERQGKKMCVGRYIWIIGFS